MKFYVQRSLIHSIALPDCQPDNAFHICIMMMNDEVKVEKNRPPNRSPYMKNQYPTVPVQPFGHENQIIIIFIRI